MIRFNTVSAAEYAEQFDRDAMLQVHRWANIAAFTLQNDNIEDSSKFRNLVNALESFGFGGGN